jgi:hypothetical protein
VSNGVSKCMYSRFDGSVGKVSIFINLSIPVYRLIAVRTEYIHEQKYAAIDYHGPVIGTAHMTLTRGLPDSFRFSAIRLLVRQSVRIKNDTGPTFVIFHVLD